MSERNWLNVLRRGKHARPSGLTEGVPAGRVPFHVAVIMDGNGRWASRRRLPVVAGHRAGAEAIRRVVEAARDAGVGQLTVFSFSTENWNRPRDEVDALMRLHAEMIDSEVPSLREKGCRVAFVGCRDGLSARLRERMEWAEETTASNQRMVLFIAFNYGGRREIIDAVHKCVAEGIDAATLTEADIAGHLYSPLMRDPDLVIRTSGERRLSNFLLWEGAYSELFFSETLWPDFDAAEFNRALEDFAARERRFGARESLKAEPDSPDA